MESLGQDLDKLIHDLEFEIQQYLKEVEQEKLLLQSLHRNTEELKTEIQRQQECTPQLDEDIKRFHKQFTVNRENKESLKRTLDVLGKHEEALVQQIEICHRDGEVEKAKQNEVKESYERKWTDYKLAYEDFELARQLQAQLSIKDVDEDSYFMMRKQTADLQQELAAMQNDDTLPCINLNDFIVKFTYRMVEKLSLQKQLVDYVTEFVKLQDEIVAKEKATQQRKENERKRREEEEQRRLTEMRQREATQARLREEENARQREAMQARMREQEQTRAHEAEETWRREEAAAKRRSEESARQRAEELAREERAALEQEKMARQRNYNISTGPGDIKIPRLSVSTSDQTRLSSAAHTRTSPTYTGAMPRPPALTMSPHTLVLPTQLPWQPRVGPSSVATLMATRPPTLTVPRVIIPGISTRVQLPAPTPTTSLIVTDAHTHPGIVSHSPAAATAAAPPVAPTLTTPGLYACPQAPGAPHTQTLLRQVHEVNMLKKTFSAAPETRDAEAPPTPPSLSAHAAGTLSGGSLPPSSAPQQKEGGMRDASFRQLQDSSSAHTTQASGTAVTSTEQSPLQRAQGNFQTASTATSESCSANHSHSEFSSPVTHALVTSQPDDTILTSGYDVTVVPEVTSDASRTPRRPSTPQTPRTPKTPVGSESPENNPKTPTMSPLDLHRHLANIKQFACKSPGEGFSYSSRPAFMGLHSEAGEPSARPTESAFADVPFFSTFFGGSGDADSAHNNTAKGGAGAGDCAVTLTSPNGAGDGTSAGMAAFNFGNSVDMPTSASSGFTFGGGVPTSPPGPPSSACGLFGSASSPPSSTLGGFNMFGANSDAPAGGGGTSLFSMFGGGEPASAESGPRGAGATTAAEQDGGGFSFNFGAPSGGGSGQGRSSPSLGPSSGFTLF